MRSRAFNRDVSYRKAKRKQRIAKEVYYDGDVRPYYDNLHQYSKNKIHCSCPWCQMKTRNKGKRRWKSGNYNGSLHYKPSDARKQNKMDYDINNPDDK